MAKSCVKNWVSEDTMEHYTISDPKLIEIEVRCRF